jgi:hypothetical protein
VNLLNPDDLIGSQNSCQMIFELQEELEFAVDRHQSVPRMSCFSFINKFIQTLCQKYQLFQKLSKKITQKSRSFSQKISGFPKDTRQ